MIRKFLYKIIYLYYRILNMPSIILNNVKIGRSLHLRGILYIKKARCKTKECIYIGDNVNINSSFNSDPIGGDGRTIFYTRYGGKIEIGNNCGISNSTIVSESLVRIGDYTNIGGGTKIYDTDFHSIDPDVRLQGDTDIKTRPIVIGKKVFIGGHCIILKGVTVGDGSVIGAGSVVSRSVPANEIWAGNPARFIRKVK
ncbi:MAG: acyltransferase [Lentimicrobiaceae bacterium]|nr:acyltransferase [Lentimicrobiaceae bacterium]